MNEILQNHSNPDAFYYSTIASDPDLAEIVEMFVEEMPERITSLKYEFENRHWSDLSRLAHQLKGAAGSYGFAQITNLAAELETAIGKNKGQDAVSLAYELLIDGCTRVRPGTNR